MAPTIEQLAEWREGYEKLMNERFAAHSKALELQAREYERRLEALNGEASRISKIQQEHVARPVYDVEVGNMGRRISTLEHNQAVQEGKASQNAVIVAWIIASLGLAISLVDLFKK